MDLTTTESVRFGFYGRVCPSRARTRLLTRASKYSVYPYFSHTWPDSVANRFRHRFRGAAALASIYTKLRAHTGSRVLCSVRAASFATLYVRISTGIAAPHQEQTRRVEWYGQASAI